MGKYSLIVIAGFALTFGIIKNNLHQTGGHLSDNFLDHFEQAEARLAANSMAHMSLATLRDTTTWRTGYAGVQVSGWTGWAALEDNSTDSTLDADQVRITAGGASGSSTDTVVVVATVPTVPPGVKGGVTANSVVRTLGGLIIDGRNHDLNGNAVTGQGTMGVSTTQTYNQGGSSTGGGTAGGVDYAPSNPANPAVIEENAAYAFPATPDDVFEFSVGTLKSMAQSGANGSQYVTDPADLSFPLSGVTYAELASGDTWQSIDFGSSSGVIVVHNSSGNAAMKNLNGGTFKGLIIADDIEKIHSTIIGAIVSLTTSPSGNCIGNGSGQVLYSRQALLQAGSVAAGGSGGVTITSWRE